MQLISAARDGKIPLESLFDIAREFDVSVESVLWRMHFVYNRAPSNSELTKAEIDQAKRLRRCLRSAKVRSLTLGRPVIEHLRSRHCGVGRSQLADSRST